MPDETSRETETELIADKTRTEIRQGNVEMEIHQPHGALQLIRLYDGVEIFSRVTDEGRATTTVQLTWEQAEQFRDSLNEVLEER